MESELLKLLADGGAQLILASGYLPAAWLIRTLWRDREALQLKLLSMLEAKFADAANAKDLWTSQAKVIEDQTRTIGDMKVQIAALIEELRRARA